MRKDVLPSRSSRFGGSIPTGSVSPRARATNAKTLSYAERSSATRTRTMPRAPKPKSRATVEPQHVESKRLESTRVEPRRLASKDVASKRSEAKRTQGAHASRARRHEGPEGTNAPPEVHPRQRRLELGARSSAGRLPGTTGGNRRADRSGPIARVAARKPRPLRARTQHRPPCFGAGTVRARAEFSRVRGCRARGHD